MTQPTKSGFKSFFFERLGNPGDYPFIIDSWVKSNQNSPWGREAGRVYMRAHKELIRKTLSGLLVSIRVAHVPDDSEAILGWACLNPESLPGLLPIIHYIYVKSDARGLGIARALLRDVLPKAAEYSHKPVFGGLPIPKNWNYNPYRAFLA